LQTGLVFFFVGGVSVFTQAVLLPALSKKFSRLTLTLYGIGVFAVGLVALAAVQNLAFLFIVAALISFGFGIQLVTLNTLISLNTPKDAQGGALGVAWTIAGLAQTLAPVLAASVFSFGVSVGFVGLVFVVSAVVSVVTVPLVLSFKKASE
jgi:MFS family permease